MPGTSPAISRATYLKQLRSRKDKFEIDPGFGQPQTCIQWVAQRLEECTRAPKWYVYSFCTEYAGNIQMIEKGREGAKNQHEREEKKQARKKKKESSVDLTREERHEWTERNTLALLTMPGAVVNVNNEVGSAFFCLACYSRLAGCSMVARKKQKERRCLRAPLLATAN